jgi:hypothetical protein
MNFRHFEVPKAILPQHRIKSRGVSARYWNPTNGPRSTGLAIKNRVLCGLTRDKGTAGKYTRTLGRYRNHSGTGNASFSSMCQRLPDGIKVIWRVSPSHPEHTATYFCFVSLKITTNSLARLIKNKHVTYERNPNYIRKEMKSRSNLGNASYRSVQNKTFHIPVFCLET